MYQHEAPYRELGSAALYEVPPPPSIYGYEEAPANGQEMMMYEGIYFFCVCVRWVRRVAPPKTSELPPALLGLWRGESRPVPLPDLRLRRVGICAATPSTNRILARAAGIHISTRTRGMYGPAHTVSLILFSLHTIHA